MSVSLQRSMTLAEFLAWEERQELRYEFDGMQPVAMTGGTLRHEAIGRNAPRAFAGSRRIRHGSIDREFRFIQARTGFCVASARKDLAWCDDRNVGILGSSTWNTFYLP